ncbi:MAG: hypothetical protein A2176_15710 [Spirochaetes bacterium RBG_13_51_14]|nr:MAG: hypothetical protein A2176_15710 [Spirochaetes bacterium RBG_13_51_14]
MRNRVISIVTGWGGHLGTGHIQRMISLADYLSRRKRMEVSLVCGRVPEFISPTIRDYFRPAAVPGSDCVVRDMRDSSIDEILNLKKLGRIIAVDDCGPGRDCADRAIDLLPNMCHSVRNKKMFLYGYNFFNSVYRMNEDRIIKTTDVAFYCGYNPQPETVEFLLSLVPSDCTAALCAGNESLIVTNRKSSPLRKTYAETLLSAKVLVSHFGIALYEGHIAGCRLASVNPSEYHSRLADMASHDIDAINLGMLKTIHPDESRKTLSLLIANPRAEEVYPAAVLSSIEAGLEHFYNEIRDLVDDRTMS